MKLNYELIIRDIELNIVFSSVATTRKGLDEITNDADRYISQLEEDNKHIAPWNSDRKTILNTGDNLPPQ